MIIQAVHDYSQPKTSAPSQALVEQQVQKKNPIPRVQPEMETFPKMMVNRKERVMVTTGLKLLCAAFSSPCGFEEGGKREKEEMCLNYWP